MSESDSLRGTRDDSERREFFRVTDRVSLSVRTLDQDVDPVSRGAAVLATSFDDMTRDVTRQLEMSRNEHPTLTMYLDTLNTKLDRIANWLALRELELPAEPTHQVDISASGVGFITDKPYDLGSVVELRLLLFPDHTCLVLNATVSRSESLGDGRFDTGLLFDDIAEADRDRLAGHVARCQSLALRARASARNGG